MQLNDSITPSYNTGGNPIHDLNGYVSGYSPYTMTVGSGLTKLEHFMLEITKAVVQTKGTEKSDPRVIVNRAQVIFEELKKRIEDIETKGLLSDNKL